jgi:hypothetical protein
MKQVKSGITMWKNRKNRTIFKNSHVNFGNVLWVAFSIPPGSLLLVKYPVYVYGR